MPTKGLRAQQNARRSGAWKTTTLGKEDLKDLKSLWKCLLSVFSRIDEFDQQALRVAYPTSEEIAKLAQRDGFCTGEKRAVVPDHSCLWRCVLVILIDAVVHDAYCGDYLTQDEYEKLQLLISASAGLDVCLHTGPRVARVKTVLKSLLADLKTQCLAFAREKSHCDVFLAEIERQEELGVFTSDHPEVAMACDLLESLGIGAAVGVARGTGLQMSKVRSQGKPMAMVALFRHDGKNHFESPALVSKERLNQVRAAE
jgi:hypothetical protein